MFAHLKKATIIEHQQLEKVLVAELKRVSRPEDYLKILQTFYGYYDSLERAIWQHLPIQFVPDRKERRSSRSLIEDIHMLGGNAEPARFEPNFITDVSTAAGALYVYEGSSLGGHAITSMVTSRVPGLGSACSFFAFYGDKAFSKWADFRTMLEKQEGAIELEKMAFGALKTFETLKEWIISRHL